MHLAEKPHGICGILWTKQQRETILSALPSFCQCCWCSLFKQVVLHIQWWYWSGDYFDTWSAPKLLFVSDRKLRLMCVKLHLNATPKHSTTDATVSLPSSLEWPVALEFALKQHHKKQREKTHPVFIKPGSREELITMQGTVFFNLPYQIEE